MLLSYTQYSKSVKKDVCENFLKKYSFLKSLWILKLKSSPCVRRFLRIGRIQIHLIGSTVPVFGNHKWQKVLYHSIIKVITVSFSKVSVAWVGSTLMVHVLAYNINYISCVSYKSLYFTLLNRKWSYCSGNFEILLEIVHDTSRNSETHKLL